MSENCGSFRKASEGANGEMAGVHFIELKEIMDVSEAQAISPEEGEELRSRLCEAERRLREKRELYDRLYEHGLDIEELMNEMAAENQCLTSRVKEFQQQVEDIRKRRGEEDEEALHQRLLSEEEHRSQFIYIRQMENEIVDLRNMMEDLTAEVEQLSVGRKYQGQIQTLRTAVRELKHELEQGLCHTDEETEEQHLRQEQGELQEQQSRSRNEQIISAENQLRGSTTDDEEHKNKSYWSCLRGLCRGVKVAGHVALCVLLPVGVMASMVPVSTSQDLWNMAFNLLEPYCELHHTVPPLF